jgi:hypothetical protein
MTTTRNRLDGEPLTLDRLEGGLALLAYLVALDGEVLGRRRIEGDGMKHFKLQVDGRTTPVFGVVIAVPVCTESLNASVLVMKSAKDTA